MRWLTGERVRPILNFRLRFSLSGGLKVNFCTREVKKMNSSDLANCSPRHTRFPERQKDKLSSQLVLVPSRDGNLPCLAKHEEEGPGKLRDFTCGDSFNLPTP